MFHLPYLSIVLISVLVEKRKLLTAAAAAGISVAFGSPLGGVLFCLEELELFSSDSDVMWRGFVTSAIAAMALQYIDPFGTGRLVLFEVKGFGDTWRGFELVGGQGCICACEFLVR